jgi:hypothetical protein
MRHKPKDGSSIMTCSMRLSSQAADPTKVLGFCERGEIMVRRSPNMRIQSSKIIVPGGGAGGICRAKESAASSERKRPRLCQGRIQ